MAAKTTPATRQALAALALERVRRQRAWHDAQRCVGYAMADALLASYARALRDALASGPVSFLTTEQVMAARGRLDHMAGLLRGKAAHMRQRAEAGGGKISKEARHLIRVGVRGAKAK